MTNSLRKRKSKIEKNYIEEVDCSNLQFFIPFFSSFGYTVSRACILFKLLYLNLNNENHS